ncbi:MAG: polysaccharide deacetylase family protein [Jaaginema sp. PMC 1079.18]|nr:polysaccharide deacetylase family protein [Jaaginema sp. PMC 1080.18]MEC4851307.1 polysaccharide deacetylase family protein [Jaaginema sp. PMC 1079.18]MEC4866320.1 polysaccharide deacetylase family protein [Jaaginema sp. PMC 1078.18]
MQFAPLYPWLYKVLKPTFSDCLWSGRLDVPQVALTFDDGPHPQYTQALLKVLDDYQVPGSFFWLGECVARSPKMAQAVAARSHHIGLHGYTHRSFPRLTDRELRESLRQTQDIIAQTCGIERDRLVDVRPPNGLFTPRTLKLLRQWHYRPVMWSVVPEDWVCPGVNTVIERVLQQVTPGSLIVLHDGNCGGRDVAAIADYLIRALQQRGYHFVTIEQLWRDRDEQIKN